MSFVYTPTARIVNSARLPSDTESSFGPQAIQAVKDILDGAAHAKRANAEFAWTTLGSDYTTSDKVNFTEIMNVTLPNYPGVFVIGCLLHAFTAQNSVANDGRVRIRTSSTYAAAGMSHAEFDFTMLYQTELRALRGFVALAVGGTKVYLEGKTNATIAGIAGVVAAPTGDAELNIYAGTQLFAIGMGT